MIPKYLLAQLTIQENKINNNIICISLSHLQLNIDNINDWNDFFIAIKYEKIIFGHIGLLLSC